MEDLFAIIGKLYVDMHSMQKLLEHMKQQLKDKDSEIIKLKQQARTKDE
jgi:hypothetical protein